MKTVTLNCAKKWAFVFLAWRYLKRGEPGSVAADTPRHARDSASWGCFGPLFDLEVFLVSCSAARLKPPSLNTLLESRAPLFCWRQLDLWNQETERQQDFSVLLLLPCTASWRGFCLSVVSSPVSLLLLSASLIFFCPCHPHSLSLSPSLSVPALFSTRFRVLPVRYYPF